MNKSLAIITVFEIRCVVDLNEMVKRAESLNSPLAKKEPKQGYDQKNQQIYNCTTFITCE